MKIVILVGGPNEHGAAEHRYLVGKFLGQFGPAVTRIVTTRPAQRALNVRLKRLIKRGNYLERFARARYPGGYGPDPAKVQHLLLPDDNLPIMPGGDRCVLVPSHNSPECEAILEQERPDIIVVYGTAIIRPHIFKRAQCITLNMHTGLSPYYRGDSTLFWPVFYNEPERLGVTVHELVESVDGGDIINTAEVHYATGDGEAELFAKGVSAGTAIYLQAVQDCMDGKLKKTPQDLSLGREFRWIHRTVDAERQVLAQLERWAAEAKKAA